jgi:hypothetical protein
MDITMDEMIAGLFDIIEESRSAQEELLSAADRVASVHKVLESDGGNLARLLIENALQKYYVRLGRIIVRAENAIPLAGQ